MTARQTLLLAVGACAIAIAIASCNAVDSGGAARYRWWSGLGPVLPHDSFPTDCALCHVGDDWNTLVADFAFDHLAETGTALSGAHQEANCLLCHNDRGPVQMFAARGCVGCHEDLHQGDLGPTCTSCHDTLSWQPRGQVELHARTRFPLSGVHAATSCHRCHPGAFAGEFMPTDPDCVTCHADELAAATNPPHANLGWLDCGRCHIPTSWNQAWPR